MKALPLLLALLVAAPIAAEPVALPAVGLQLERPDNWAMRTQGDNSRAVRNVEFTNPDDQRQAVEHLSNLPLIMLTRQTAIDAPVSPTVRVTVESVRSVGNMASTEFLQSVITFFGRNFPDADFFEGPVESSRFGAGGAQLRVAYTARGNFGEIPVRAQMWVVRRGELWFVLSISMARDEPEEMWTEADAILDSVRISWPAGAR